MDKKKITYFVDSDKIVFDDVTVYWYVTYTFNKTMAQDIIMRIDMFQRKLLFICEVNLLPNILKYLDYCYIIIELACYSIYKILTKMPWVDCHIFLDNISIMIE